MPHRLRQEDPPLLAYANFDVNISRSIDGGIAEFESPNSVNYGSFSYGSHLVNVVL